MAFLAIARGRSLEDLKRRKAQLEEMLQDLKDSDWDRTTPPYTRSTGYMKVGAWEINREWLLEGDLVMLINMYERAIQVRQMSEGHGAPSYLRSRRALISRKKI